jgi:hypothetical protein
LSGKNGVRGRRGGSPEHLGRTERRGEAGFVVYCKCEVFSSFPPDVLAREDWRRGTCRGCGALKREWRCPLHGLRATPLEGHDSEGCPRCGQPPQEQRHDPYMTKKALHG